MFSCLWSRRDALPAEMSGKCFILGYFLTRPSNRFHFDFCFHITYSLSLFLAPVIGGCQIATLPYFFRSGYRVLAKPLFHLFFVAHIYLSISFFFKTFPTLTGKKGKLKSNKTKPYLVTYAYIKKENFVEKLLLMSDNSSLFSFSHRLMRNRLV